MTVYDLFAGIGGWDFAAQQLGLDPVGVEIWEPACQTRSAAGLKTLQQSVRDVEIYRSASAVTSDAAEIFERIYVAVAGENFRMDRKRANAAYAVVAYFFDSCHIFEMPPAVLEGADAATN